jgi:hypothetical protein
MKIRMKTLDFKERNCFNINLIQMDKIIFDDYPFFHLIIDFSFAIE